MHAPTPKIKKARLSGPSLAIEKSEENQDADGHQRNFGCDIDETSKGFFLNVDIHFTVLMISHFAFPS
jgi:hypothetical protein